MDICAVFWRKKNRLVVVTMTVVRMVVKLVEVGLLRLETREDVRGPCAATTEATVERKSENLVHIVGRGSAGGGVSGGKTCVGKKSRGKGQESRTA